MKFNGNIELQENEIQKMVFESETQFPDVPKAGRVVFKDKKLYLCVALNNTIPAWIPLTNTINTHVHEQQVSSTTWTMAHNFNTVSPLVQIYDDTHKMIIPDEIEPLSNNVIRATFSNQVFGRAIIMYGDIIPDAGIGILEPEKVMYTETFSNQSVIVVRHNLGYYPIVRAFVSDVEVQPQSVIHDDIFTTTVSFSSSEIGELRFI